MTPPATVTDRLLVFVIQKFPLARKRQLGIDDPLLESGIVDSLGVLEVVSFSETEFGVQMADEESALAAVEGLRGKELNGRVMDVVLEDRRGGKPAGRRRR